MRFSLGNGVCLISIKNHAYFLKSFHFGRFFCGLWFLGNPIFNLPYESFIIDVEKSADKVFIKGSFLFHS